MRVRRRAVPFTARRVAAARVAQLLRTPFLRPGVRVALYTAFDGEIDTAVIATLARRRGCHLFVPVIVDARHHRMEFVRTTHSASIRPNQFGIREPRDALSRRIDPQRLDVILLPLLAFDAFGWRLGFGGGYYDRKLAFKHRSALRKPLLIGVGYEFQRISPVLPSHWDVKLDYVVTERGLHPCRRLFLSSV